MQPLIKSGFIVDILQRRTFHGQLEFEDGIITNIKELEGEPEVKTYILPGFIDSHVHIESSMLVPAEFAKMAVVHGTVGTVSDPHEIANVCGMEGVRYMIENGKTVPFIFNFGAPSCVPATIFETAGASLSADDVDSLLALPEISYLSEMMNFPGVVYDDAEILKKIASAKKYDKPVDGHAPGLSGAALEKYIHAGISTDHECFTEAEAAEKLANGMKILIREGSAAKNFDALIPLMHDHYENMMFCSDDKHPDSLVEGHINVLCARAVAVGVDVYKVLLAACINPVRHYNMQVGLLQPGHKADFIEIKDLKDFEVISTFINGQLVSENGISFIKTTPPAPLNHFNCVKVSPADFALPASGLGEIHVIEAIDGQLITNKLLRQAFIKEGFMLADVENDILKIAVVNRYHQAPVSVSFIKNFGLKQGAIASSVAHDSHNIVVVGTNEEDIAKAVNLIISARGGISAVGESDEISVALPIAGLMSNKAGYEVAAEYTEIDNYVKEELGSTLASPFMTLSFMALLVIPHLKLSDKGLFDGDSFSFIDHANT